MKVQCTKTETYTICPMTGLVKVPQRTAEAPTSATVMPTNLHCATCLVIVRVEYTLSEMHQLSHMKCCYGLSHFSDTTSKASFSPTTTRPWNCVNRSLAFTLHTRPNHTSDKLDRSEALTANAFSVLSNIQPLGPDPTTCSIKGTCAS